MTTTTHGIYWTYSSYESAATAVSETGGKLSPVWRGSWEGDRSEKRGAVVGKWKVHTPSPTSAGCYDTLTEFENGDFVLFSAY